MSYLYEHVFHGQRNDREGVYFSCLIARLKTEGINYEEKRSKAISKKNMAVGSTFHIGLFADRMHKKS